MKVYLHYNEGEPKITIKVKLPKKWKTGPVSNLTECVVDQYNAKHAAGDNKVVEPLAVKDFHLELDDGKELLADAKVNECINDLADLYLKPGKSKTVEEVENIKKEKLKKQSDDDSNLVTCKRFGCQKKFDPAKNHDTACVYHESPPVFHETNKWWSCCPHIKGYDWDSFQAIKGCKVGRHSSVKQVKKFLGGSDMRAEGNDYAPKRIDGGGNPKAPQSSGTGATKGKILSPLEKLLSLRKALIQFGVPGKDFDAARDAIKAKHESAGKDVWLHVCKELQESLSSGFKEIGEK